MPGIVVVWVWAICTGLLFFLIPCSCHFGWCWVGFQSLGQGLVSSFTAVPCSMLTHYVSMMLWLCCDVCVYYIVAVCVFHHTACTGSSANGAAASLFPQALGCGAMMVPWTMVHHSCYLNTDTPIWNLLVFRSYRALHLDCGKGTSQWPHDAAKLHPNQGVSNCTCHPQVKEVATWQHNTHSWGGMWIKASSKGERLTAFQKPCCFFSWWAHHPLPAKFLLMHEGAI